MKTIFLMICLAFSAATTTAQVAPLKNDDIVDLTKAGLSAESIIAKIKRSECKFETEPGDLVKLKEERVSNEVIQAMIECEIPKIAADTSPAARQTTPATTTASLAIQA